MCANDRYKPCYIGDVVMVDGSRSKAVGIGIVKMKMYVPSSRKNLVSMSKLDTLGYDFYVKNKFIKVGKRSLVIMKAKKIDNLYKLIGDPVRGVATTTTNDKVNIDNKLNLKSCISNDSARQEKH